MLTMAALLVLANIPGANAPSAPRERPVACSALAIRSDADSRDRDRFSATRILELRFGTRLAGQPRRDHTLRLRLYAPSGFLYQVLAVPVASGQGRRRIEARLPVAGTSIMASGLYGRWRVVPQLDDSSEPCGAGRSFVIRP